MSVNTQRQDDVQLPTTSHYHQQVNVAAVTSLLYNDAIGRRQNYRSMNHHQPGNVGNAGVETWDPSSGKMSASRRTFCLITTFDLILTCLLWIIYTQLIGMKPIWNAFEKQVQQYTFDDSLFDTVMMSCTRFTFIILAYALLRINHVWVIAVTTSMTCAYLLVKCFMFEFSDALLGGKNPLSYVVLIVSFVLAWVETWMLDFRVLPLEKSFRDRARQTDRRGLLTSDTNTNASTEESERQYFSPYHTPSVSERHGMSGLFSKFKRKERRKKEKECIEDSEEEPEIQSCQSSQSTNTRLTDEDIEAYQKLIDKAKESMWDILHMDGWKQESGKNLIEGTVHSKHMKEYGRKIFKLQGIVNMAPKDHWHEMIAGLNDSVKWNTTIIESRDIQTIDDNTVVTYNISAEAAGGLVKTRDFINVRHWYERAGIYMSVAIGATHPDMPVQKKHIRGDNGPGGWTFEPVADEPNQCLFTWIVNSNLKGWIPQSVIDQAMGGVLIQFFKLMNAHLAEVTSQRSVL